MHLHASKAETLQSYLESVHVSLQRRRGGRVALVGLAAFCAFLLAGLWLFYRSDFQSGFLTGFRFSLILALLAAAAAVFVVWRRRISLLNVARYVEEKNPALKQRLVTAADRSSAEASPLWPLLEKDALRAVQSARLATVMEQQRPWFLGALGALVLTATMLLMGPSFFKYGFEKLFALTRAKGPLYEFSVQPGNVRLAPGVDQEIQALPVGFNPREVTLFYRFQNQIQWEQTSMERSSLDGGSGAGGFSFLLMDIREPVRYYVEADRVRSPEFQMEVAEWPRAEKLLLEYTYPAYTGLKSQRVEDDGNIRAIQGTRVKVQVKFTLAPQKPELFFENGNQAVGLQQQADGTYAAELDIQKDDHYWIRTATPEGDVRSSPSYEVVALQDQPPQVKFNEPGRDIRVSLLQEVVSQLEASDDFGLRSLDLVYSVNGGKEESLHLFGPGNEKDVSRDHTFYLEEMKVKPGDFVSYHGVARDAVNTAKTDMYFLEVRPFDREFRQSQQSGGGGGGGGQQEDMILSRRQKEIIAGTWKLTKDDKNLTREAKAESFRTLSLVQQRLQEQANQIVERLRRRSGSFAADNMARQMMEALQKAAELMSPAHEKLSQEQAENALSFEQQALQRLLQAEALMKEVQVAWGQQGGGGGGGGDSRAEDLADLFELERDQEKNQYETLQQSQPGQQRDAGVDEALQKLKELARRQQQSLNSEMSAVQRRRLQQETEELARQLDRLSRQRQNQQMEEAARQLQQASRDMQNAMQGQSGTAASQALDRMQRAQQQLSQMQQQRQEQRFSQLQQSAEALRQKQQQIEEKLNSVQQQAQRRGSVSRNDLMNVLRDKESLRQGLRTLEQELDEAARESQSQQKDAAQQLKSAANEIRDRRLQEKILQGGAMIQRGMLDQAKQREHSLTEEFKDLEQRLAGAAQSAQNAPQRGPGDDSASKLQRALQDAGRLLDQLEQAKRDGNPGDKNAAGESGQEDQNREPGSGQNPDSQDRQGQGRTAQSQQGRQQEPGPQPGQGQRQAGRQQSGQQGQQGQQPGQQGQQGQQPGQAGQEASNQGSQQGESGQQGESAGSQSGQPSGSRQPGRSEGSGDQGMANGQTAEAQQAGRNAGRPSSNMGNRGSEQWGQFWQDRIRDAQQIRRSLEGERELARQVDDLVERMRQADLGRLSSAMGTTDLQAAIIQGFRALELKMSLKLQGKNGNLQLFNPEEVPLQYRQAVEDYYRSLARSKENAPR